MAAVGYDSIKTGLTCLSSHISHFAPKSIIFQNAWGVRKFGSPHFLHEYTTIIECIPGGTLSITYYILYRRVWV
jgi:hypothetical protein